MAYCEDKAIPHSVFLGRVVAAGEPYWLTEDRAKVIAHRLEKAGRCTKCGTSDWEWDADPDAYEPVAMKCIGCQKISTASDSDSYDSSVQVVLLKQVVATAMRRKPRKRPVRRRDRSHS